MDEPFLMVFGMKQTVEGICEISMTVMGIGKKADHCHQTVMEASPSAGESHRVGADRSATSVGCNVLS
jgi:hypothetical protein